MLSWRCASHPQTLDVMTNPAPKLSVVLISYNMARELPRTIRSLSPSMQCGVLQSDYEVIVVDNGSTAMFGETECRRWIPTLVVHHSTVPTVSPVAAINKGLEIARGDLVGVFIDGARMASPGLLCAALAASQTHARPVIGTVAFHLGPDVQSRSIHNGYNQDVEDTLLQSISWEQDGYRLFDISAFAGSSAAGWFALPAETSALFLTADHWREFGGYDEAFLSPGGGLANLDTWSRLCADPQSPVIMLLGESTFHQLHGGIATNAATAMWPSFASEYQRIRGTPYRRPTRRPLFLGPLNPRASESLRKTIRV
jgi:hypothetical protein